MDSEVDGRDVRAGCKPTARLLGEHAAVERRRRLHRGPVDLDVEEHHDDHRDPERAARRVDDVARLGRQHADRSRTGARRSTSSERRRRRRRVDHDGRVG